MVRYVCQHVFVKKVTKNIHSDASSPTISTAALKGKNVSAAPWCLMLKCALQSVQKAWFCRFLSGRRNGHFFYNSKGTFVGHGISFSLQVRECFPHLYHQSLTHQTHQIDFHHCASIVGGTSTELESRSVQDDKHVRNSVQCMCVCP